LKSHLNYTVLTRTVRHFSRNRMSLACWL